MQRIVMCAVGAAVIVMIGLLGKQALRELGRSECVEQRPVRFAGV